MNNLKMFWCGALAILFFISIVSACSCVNPNTVSLNDSYNNSEAVFVGRVEAISSPSTETSLSVLFLISQSWKGPTDEIIVKTAKDSAACGYHFEKNKEYLVFVSESDGQYYTGLCGKNQLKEVALENIRKLNELYLNDFNLGCQDYYWFDNVNKTCDQKQFCGTFMYQGLQIFETKGECESAKNSQNNGCTEEAKICSDGTTVSRNPSRNCEFDPCSEENQCSQDSDCKLIYGPCECAAVLTTDTRTELDEGTIQCMWNGCYGINVTAICQKNKCIRSDKIYVLSNGRKAEIKIMPAIASVRARDRLGELGFNVELKEIGNDKVVYELTAEKEGKVFGLFRAKGKVMALVNVETGGVEKINKPWWAFLASGI